MLMRKINTQASNLRRHSVYSVELGIYLQCARENLFSFFLIFQKEITLYSGFFNRIFAQFLTKSALEKVLGYSVQNLCVQFWRVKSMIVNKSLK